MSVSLGALALTLGLWLQAAPAPNSHSSQESPTSKDALSALFTRAQTDPAGVVPLILYASESLRGADANAGDKTGDKLDEKARRLLGDTLEPFCRRVFFSPERFPGMERLGLVSHVVREGEVPERIAKPYRIGAGMLGYLNADFEPRRLRVGQTLKVLDLSSKGGGGLQIVVDKGSYRLAAWRELASGGRALVLYVPVGLGAEASPTPVGKTSIVLRALDPEWTDPVTKNVYKAGDPLNVLGGYWIALDSAGLGQTGIGLHGFTGDVPANWIEQPASHGCVRMLQADIDRFFHLAVEGTPVEIVP